MILASLALLVDEPDRLTALDEVVLHSGHYWPVLLAVPLVVLAFVWAARQRRRAVEALGNPELVSRLVGSVHHGRRVLVAVDFSAWSAPLVDLARRVAPRAHLVLLSAYAVPFEGKLRYASVPDATIKTYREQARRAAEQQLHALAAGAGLTPGQWTPCLPHADASLAIVRAELEQACDLIVIGKHGRNMVEEMLLGSVTSHVLAESAGDVLVSTETLA